MESIHDNQRPSGQLPGIIPSGGWAYNWGSGPAYDILFFLIPYNVYLFYGNAELIDEYYNDMKKYLDFCMRIADNELIEFGLGDWAPFNPEKAVSFIFTSTAYYFYAVSLMSQFARIRGNRADAVAYQQLADNIKLRFNREFYHGGGSYAEDQLTALSCAIFMNLCPDLEEQKKTVDRLVEEIKLNGAVADVGILGSKYVPRVLADHGCEDLAFKFITQTKFPGWGHWIKQGATTLWEGWSGESSRNHIMRGDISAWFYKYIGGISPNIKSPGFKEFTVKPGNIKKIDWAEVEYKSPYGNIVSNWRRKNDIIEYQLSVPQNTTAHFIFPDNSDKIFKAGNYSFARLG